VQVKASVKINCRLGEAQKMRTQKRADRDLKANLKERHKTHDYIETIATSKTTGHEGGQDLDSQMQGDAMREQIDVMT